MDTTTASVGEIKPLFEAGLHLGHKKNRLHPAAKRYVYKTDAGVSIIDLGFTFQQLARAKEFLKQCAAEEKTVLVVATKKVASDLALEMCRAHNISHITSKWLPGLLTNFETIIKNVKKLNDLKTQKEEGQWEKLTKHEIGKLNKYVARMERLYGGLTSLKKKPDVLFVVDVRKEKNAVNEAKQTEVSVIGICDTNANPQTVDYPIVANDDSPAAVKYLITDILNAYIAPKAKKSTPIKSGSKSK